MKRSYKNDTIVAVSTPVGEGGIGIVRLSGPRAISTAQGVFLAADRKKLSGVKSHSINYGYIVQKKHKSAPRIIDEVLVSVMRAPRTYTREDVVEINCHGGIQAARKTLEVLMAYGARLAEPGEFTKRAFLNGRIDLAQAEAVLDVISARTEASMRAAVSQLDGTLSSDINAIRDRMLSLASEIEASIDFPDEGMPPADKNRLIRLAGRIVKDLKSMLGTYDDGAVLREGVLAIICGKPNAGKSSLMNLLLKRDRVIVSPVPGTTRDAVEETINLKGVPIRLVDTAGIARTRHALSLQGIAKSKSYLKLADIAIFVLDGSKKLDAHDAEIARLLGSKNKIMVINKSDLPRRIEMKKARAMASGSAVVSISVSNRKNIGSLEKAILRSVWSGKYAQSETAIVTNARHKELLDKALGCMLSVDKAATGQGAPELMSVDLREAIDSLGLILGKSVSDDVLDRIFGRFCIGK